MLIFSSQETNSGFLDLKSVVAHYAAHVLLSESESYAAD